MVYVDTSALVPVFIREPSSEATLAWLGSSDSRLAISEWCLVEFASAASMKVRSGHLTGSLAAEACRRVRDFAGRRCSISVPGREEFQRAAELAADAALKLRAGDALHLAMVEALKADAILCFDTGMTEAAKSLGLSVVTV